MELTNEQIQELRDLKKLPDSDEIRIKEKIKRKLLDNEKLIYILDNKELLQQDVGVDEYYGINILPYYLIHPTQSHVSNFVCYTTGYRDISRNNRSFKLMNLTFVVLCEEKTIIEKNTGIARHDLLAHLIIDQFNQTNIFGNIIECIRNEETVVDGDYACRTIVFEQTIDNNLVKTRNGNTNYARIDVIR